MTEQPLLDWLWGQCRCEYLSQLYALLPGDALALTAAKKLSEISFDQFDAAQWTEGLRYLSGGGCECSSQEAAQLYRTLLSYLAPKTQNA